MAVVPVGTLLAMYSLWALLSGIPRLDGRGHELQITNGGVEI
jgi:hypothetical protein